ncbi:MAG TPA: hypothetical protein VF775_00530 [Geobacteraceae bacterium]
MGNVTSSKASWDQKRAGRVQIVLTLSIMALIVGRQVSGQEVTAPPEVHPANTAQASDKKVISVKGTVAHVDLEGGFWGIVGDDGKHYDTVNLPREFRKEGLRVKFVGRTRPDRISYHMWGIIVEVVSIEKIGETNDQQRNH